MGKKAKTKRGEQRALGRKVDKSVIPPPPPPLEEEIGSKRLLPEPKVPGSKFKVLDCPDDDAAAPGYDDGGVGDLTLIIDLEDRVLRRKRGDNSYFSAVKADVLPRVTTGQMASMTRREQKIHLATLLFSDGDVSSAAQQQEQDDEDNSSPSEVYIESVGEPDEEQVKRRTERLKTAKKSLRLSNYLSEPACATISLTEISKRILLLDPKNQANVALRVANKAIEMSGDGYYDSDQIAMEAEENPVVDDKYERNATTPGLSHPTNLKYFPKRTSILCLRAGYLHKGNALSALGRHDEAREAYQQVLPLLEGEPRCCRLDWERNSALVNIGNTYSRQGDYEKANDYFNQAERLGQDHIDAGNASEGMGLRMIAMRARAFALKKNGKEQEAKDLLREVLKMQVEYTERLQAEKAEMKAQLVVQSSSNENGEQANGGGSANPAL